MTSSVFLSGNMLVHRICFHWQVQGQTGRHAHKHTQVVMGWDDERWSAGECWNHWMRPSTALFATDILIDFGLHVVSKL